MGEQQAQLGLGWWPLFFFEMPSFAFWDLDARLHSVIAGGPAVPGTRVVGYQIAPGRVNDELAVSVEACGMRYDGN